MSMTPATFSAACDTYYRQLWKHNIYRLVFIGILTFGIMLPILIPIVWWNLRSLKKILNHITLHPEDIGWAYLKVDIEKKYGLKVATHTTAVLMTKCTEVPVGYRGSLKSAREFIDAVHAHAPHAFIGNHDSAVCHLSYFRNWFWEAIDQRYRDVTEREPHQDVAEFLEGKLRALRAQESGAKNNSGSKVAPSPATSKVVCFCVIGFMISGTVCGIIFGSDDYEKFFLWTFAMGFLGSKVSVLVIAVSREIRHKQLSLFDGIYGRTTIRAIICFALMCTFLFSLFFIRPERLSITLVNPADTSMTISYDDTEFSVPAHGIWTERMRSWIWTSPQVVIERGSWHQSCPATGAYIINMSAKHQLSYAEAHESYARTNGKYTDHYYDVDAMDDKTWTSDVVIPLSVDPIAGRYYWRGDVPRSIRTVKNCTCSVISIKSDPIEVSHNPNDIMRKEMLDILRNLSTGSAAGK